MLGEGTVLSKKKLCDGPVPLYNRYALKPLASETHLSADKHRQRHRRRCRRRRCRRNHRRRHCKGQKKIGFFDQSSRHFRQF
jgi:hypothetical protein